MNVPLIVTAFIHSARAGDPDPGPVFDALATLPPGWTSAQLGCPEERLVLRPPGDGPSWVCTATPTFTCAPSDRPGCIEIGSSTAVPPISAEAFAVLAGTWFRPFEGAPLLLRQDTAGWVFAMRVADGDVVSPPVEPPTADSYSVWPADFPAVDLAPVLGRPAWGVVATSGTEGMGNNAFGEYTHTLVVLARHGDQLLDVGRVRLGNEGFWRSMGEYGFSHGERFDVRCPVVRGRELLVFRSCEGSGDPRDNRLSYREACAPACFAGRSPRSRLVGRGGILVPAK
jgi:hypothetical protein